MFDDEVVVLHALNIPRYVTVNVVGFFVVLKVFVVCEYSGFKGQAE